MKWTGDLRIYNTLVGRKEKFVPLQPGRVHMYVCGITAYDFCHIGHARSAIVFDVIYRYLLHLGYQVIYVRNFTDVDDKIINRAREEKCDPAVIAERYIAAFYEDMDRLAVLRPTHEPRASQFVAEMIEVIDILVKKGLAYQVDGDVYFAVDKFSGYGKLSKRNLDEMIAGARVAVGEKKRNPLDFALWKASKPGEPTWESPWGPGRPGWHIECSAMSSKYLGHSFDIHGGGRDLIFPHHENEIAQSEAAYGKPFARYWIHNGFVNVNQEKMSKSLGNFFTIREVLKRYPPEVLRFFVVSSHYRSPLDFSEESMAEAERGLERFYQTMAEVAERTALRSEDGAAGDAGSDEFALLQEKITNLPGLFKEAMDDDFNTAAAVGHLFDLNRAINRVVVSSKKQIKGREAAILRDGVQQIQQLGSILGLLQQTPAEFFEQLRQVRLTELGIPAEEIERLLEQRSQARKEKNWSRADEIRGMLEEKGIIVEDRPEGTRYRIKRINPGREADVN
ncbi:MAG: cysteine--tRNA ligase [Deltaproteobacteria bacterium]|nr:cysteine--tRNA ligase [Deltaproteobacteria bacterium]MBW2071117.1 cysteine--tRNA ligase [Deltaproteobacteria bacterium]